MFELQAFGTYMAKTMLGLIKGYTIADGGNQALYNAIAKDLGDDVLYTSTVIGSWRTDFGVFLIIKNHATGHITLVAARQLLVAIEPTGTNATSLDLDSNEHAILSRFSYTKLYSGILNNSALAAPMPYANMPTSGAPESYLVLPNGPFVNEISYIGSGHLFRVVVVVGDETNPRRRRCQITCTEKLRRITRIEPARRVGPKSVTRLGGLLGTRSDACPRGA